MKRESLIRELGLGPVWKLRDPPPAAAPAAAPIAEASSPALAGGEVAGMDWEALRETVACCRACGLCEGRKQAVLGVGDVHADWLFVGEGPGAQEDERGEPFVGQAGKLLDAMLAAIDLSAAHVKVVAFISRMR